MSLTLTGAGSGNEAAASATPDQVSGLLGWWKADALALANGNAVTTWAASGGTLGSLAQATGANQPIYNTNQQNSLPAVTFDGTNDFLATASAASPTAGATYFAVVNIVDVDAYRTLLNHAAAATWISPFSRVLLRVSDAAASKKWQFFVQDAGVAQAVSSASATTATWQLVSATYDQAADNIYVTGALVGTSSAVTGTLTSSTQPLFLGADTGGATTWNGKVGEVAYYNRGLNSSERGQVESYLRAKWAV